MVPTPCGRATMDVVAPLRDFRFLQTGTGPVADRAGALLGLLGAEVVIARDPATAATITHDGEIAIGAGPDDGPQHEAAPKTVHVDTSTGGAVTDGLRAAAAVVEVLSELGGQRVTVDGPGLATERSRLLGLPAAGVTTAGGAGRMVRAADGWVAVNLPRPSDLDLLPAWLGRPIEGEADPWVAIEAVVSERAAGEVASSGQALGLAVAEVVTPREAATDAQATARHQRFPMTPFLLDGRPPAPAPPRVVTGSGSGSVGALPHTRLRPRPLAGARVVDLSSLWAGPLAASLLVDAGAEVIKVESSGRPDGARSGSPAFFDLLNAGKRSVALDLPDPDAVSGLQALLDGADLVIEASRPRALDQLGIVRHPRWLTLTAYGATGPWRQWSGFGDDAAVAGGLVAGTPETPRFYGDAVADPLAGLHAAAAALAVLVGRAASIDLALREVANHVGGDAPPGPVPAGDGPRQRAGTAPELGEADAELFRARAAPR